jgi:DNA-binding CsgD family transcriptional regulator
MSQPVDDRETPALMVLIRSFAPKATMFEINEQRFGAVGQQEWLACRLPNADLRRLHDQIVGRLSMADERLIVFALDAASVKRDSELPLAQVLTRRELQVASLVSEGGADKEIARKLGISTHTVREHLRRACAKTNVTRRSALAALVTRRSGDPSRR